MDEKRILTLHPAGKSGVNILERRYNFIKNFIIDVVKKHNEITFKELAQIAGRKLKGKFDGKITWYIITVKLDLEARKIIERIPKCSPQKIRLYKQ
jgi:hypothetical protein